MGEEGFLNSLEAELKRGSVITREYFYKYLKKLSSTERIKVKDFLLKHGEDGIRLIGFMLEFEQTQKKVPVKEFIEGMKGNLNINHYQKNVEDFYNIQPFFYDKAKIFWFWNGLEYKYEIVDETDIMLILDRELGFCGQTISGGIKANYIEAFKRVGRERHPKEAPLKWIQFKDQAFSLKSHKVYKVTHEYFFTNPIPYTLGENTHTPTMDTLFESWVGKEYATTLYEILAYCCYRGYPIQLLFSLCGSGRNGKSQFMKIVDKFIGRDNVTSTELDLLLNNRFESFKLYKKLVCNIGETNFGILDQSSMLKKLTGGDKIGFEKKNKDPFDEYNYAKPIIASNSLPSSNDTSDGFYRRWLIIDFPNEFQENGKDIIETIPESEYNSLARKICEILPKLLDKGQFTNQGTIHERKQKYIEMSNPLEKFINEECEIGDNHYVSANKLYSAYVQFLSKNKKRVVKRKEFTDSLDKEGFYQERTSKKIKEEWVNGRWILGLKLCDTCAICDTNPIQKIHTRKPVVNFFTNDTNDINLDVNTIIRYINTHRDEKRSVCETIFGKDIIEYMLQKGDIIEYPSGYLMMN